MALVSTPSTPTPSTHKTPTFRNSWADIILVSCDGVKFYVNRGILAIVSPLFQDMFTLPQPSPQKAHGLSRVTVSEDSDTLDYLLCMIYPVPKTPFEIRTDEDVAAAEKVLAAAVKYDMVFVKNQICSSLIASALKNSKYSEPSLAVRIYTIAYRHALRDVARDAALVCLHGSVANEYFPELESIPAGTYFRLLQYHNKISTAVLSLIDTLAGNGLPTGLTDIVNCPTHYCNTGLTGAWWDDWKKRAKFVVAKAPLSEEIFSSAFTVPSLTIAGLCSDCRNATHGKWNTIERALRDGIAVVKSSVGV